MTRPKYRPLNSKRGSALVEMALIGVAFFVILLGILDFSQFLFLQQALVERARFAARWGALSDPTNSTAIRNMVLYLSSTVPTDGTTPSFGLTAGMIDVATPDAKTDNYRLVVKISGHSFALLSPYLPSSVAGAPISVTVPLGLYD